MRRVEPVSVLVVDDDEDVRATLRDLFADEGYPFAEAENGSEALAHLRASPESLVVLLDWWMPVMGGMDLLRTVAAESLLATRHAYLFLTAADSPGTSLRAQIPDGLLVRLMRKPFDIDKLLAAVGELAKVVRASSMSS